MSASTLALCLDNSFNLGLYISETSATGPSGLATAPKPTQIGLARLVTDYTTFAYLTDVYVLPEEQGKGLGTWLIECVKEVVDGMEDLRRCLLICSEGGPEEFYSKELGMQRWGTGEGGSLIMQKVGKGAVMKDERKTE